MSNYQIHYQFGNAPTAHAQQPVFMAADVDLIPESATECLLYHRATRMSVSTTNDLAMALLACDRFRTLPEHLAVIARQLPVFAEHLEALQGALLELMQHGFFTSPEQQLQRLLQPVENPEAAAVQTLYVRSNGRLETLRPLLNALAGLLAHAPTTMRCVVLEACQEPALQQATAELVAAIATASGADLRYFGLTARQRLITYLAAQTDAHPDDLRWLYQGDPEDAELAYGITLNLALTLSAGQRFLIMDDDALPQVWMREGVTPTLLLSQARESFFPLASEASAKNTALGRAEFNPLLAHSAQLGQPIQHLATLAQDQPTAFVGAMGAAALHAIGPGHRVRITQNGAWGDQGSSDLFALYLQRGEALRALTQDETTYRHATRYRSGYRSFDHGYLGHERPVMVTTLMGVDNRSLLLPTLPQGRNEDEFLGAALAFIDPAALYLHFPWMLAHHPAQARPWSGDIWEQPFTLPINRFLADLLRQIRPRCMASHPLQRLQYLQAALADFVQAPDRLCAVYEKTSLQARLARLGELKAIFAQEPQALDTWRDDMQRLITLNQTAGLGDGQLFHTRLPLLQRRLGHYVQCLAPWPQVWQCCQERGETALLTHCLA
ncbi:hypothetical protein [Thiorhodospira sibirica]|uniref:hypothetical protein n=1 Tax=Thiorhodospira sibirica TaxID=154347 RepID=UPI00022C58D8|nr:hypothetical protein [Thiorhodospira sibirica]